MKRDKTILKKELIENYSDIFEDDLLKEIVDEGSLRFIPKGEFLIDIGDELTHIPLITHGAVKIVFKDKNRDEIVLYFLEKGETLAISFINCIHSSKSIFKGIAIRDTEGIFVPIQKFDKWLVKYKTWRHFIIDSYHFRLISVVKSVRRLAFMRMDERLSKYLNDKVKAMKSNILITTHLEIAKDIHTSRTIISRLLKDLENKGKIKLRYKRIIVGNM